MGAAVLIPLVETEYGTAILFEVRSDNVPQPGEICFPGGRIEEGETATEAALRETWEELGIPPEKITVVRELEPDITLRGNVIQPILGKLDSSILNDIVLSDGEVKEIFLVPEEWFRDVPVREYYLRDEIPEALAAYMKNYPDLEFKTFYWEYEGHGIWGLTARMLRRYIMEND